MIDVDKLNKTILDLESQTETIKSVSEVFKQLATVGEEVTATSEIQKSAVQSIEEIISQFKNSYEENIETRNEFKKLQVEILKNTQVLGSQNNKLYLDFQNFTKSKLELYKSDMQLEIRNNFNRIEKLVEPNLDKISKQNNDIKQLVENCQNGFDENKQLLLNNEQSIDENKQLILNCKQGIDINEGLIEAFQKSVDNNFRIQQKRFNINMIIMIIIGAMSMMSLVMLFKK